MKIQNKTQIFYVSVFGVVLLLALVLHFFFPLPHKAVLLGGKKFTVEVVGTEALREKGLSGRTKIAENAGMLFYFPVLDTYGFWMKDMQFPIDIIWISGNAIVDMAPSVSPPVQGKEMDVPTYLPRLPANRVLEVPAGTVQRLGVKIGDIVRGL